MSQRPLFLDNLYSVKRQRRIGCFLKGCKIVFIAGATITIVSLLAVLGAHYMANMAKHHIQKEKNININSKQTNTVVYLSEKQR